MPATKKKSTAKKSTTAKSAAKKPASRNTTSREQKVAASALKLVDEAAALLRKGISTSANTTESARLQAKKEAHTLINKASDSLSGLLGTSTSVLRKAINKL